MKKSTLLSLLTAGAVIATSAGTFAAWDQTKGTATSEVLNFRAGVTTTVTAANFTETNAVRRRSKVHINTYNRSKEHTR